MTFEFQASLRLGSAMLCVLAGFLFDNGWFNLPISIIVAAICLVLWSIEP